MEKVCIALTRTHLEYIREQGPYTLSHDGIVHDRNGASLAFSMRPNPGAEECEWDRAVIAALNEIADATTAQERGE